jgi:hypothetical protein
MRIIFKKGKQREFIKRVIENLNCPSLRLLKQYGITANYQTLKSYYNENRSLPEDLFIILCRLAKIDENKIKVKKLEDNWGQVKGGKKGNKFKRR